MRKTEVPENKSPDPLPHALTSLDRCLVDGDPALVFRGNRSRRRALGLSFAIEFALLGLVILAPLITTVAQPHLTGSVYVPFAPSAPLRGKLGAKPPVPHGIRKIDAYVTFSPGRQPVCPTAAGPDQPGPEIETPSGDDSIPIGPGPLTPGLARPSNPVAPPEEAKRNGESKPVELSEGVVEAQLIARVEPRYPSLALQIRLQGTVRLRAIISREGRIASLEVISGHPLFVQAALDAVRQWYYKPTMLDGEPVEVETTISVVFQLHN